MPKTSRSSTTPASHLVSLTLAFLITGVVSCSRDSAGEQAAQALKQAPATSATKPAPAPAAGAQGTQGNQVAPGAAAAQPPGAGAPVAGPPVEPSKLPVVVARVNGNEIKKDDLVKFVHQATQASPGVSADLNVYKRVLDNMISLKLLEQEAKVEGITVTDADVKTQLDQLKAQFPNPEEFQKRLAQEGMTEAELNTEARKSFLVQKYIETKIAPQVQVTEAEAKTFYDQNQDKMKRPERAHVRHILIKADKDATPADKEKAKAKAEALLAKIKGGADFAALARENSDDPGSKANGGDLSWIMRNQTVPQFEKAAFALKPNEISPVVETQYGYHIIQLMEHQNEGTVPFAEAKDRISGFLKQQNTRQKIQDRIQELRTKGKVEVFI